MEEIECHVEDIVEFLGKKHMLKILSMFFENKNSLRFKDFTNTLGINSKTLSDRLKELEQSNLVIRTSFDEIPPRVEYTLTEIGDDLRPILETLNQFDTKYMNSKSDKIKVII